MCDMKKKLWVIWHALGLLRNLASLKTSYIFNRIRASSMYWCGASASLQHDDYLYLDNFFSLSKVRINKNGTQMDNKELKFKLNSSELQTCKHLFGKQIFVDILPPSFLIKSNNYLFIYPCSPEGNQLEF